MESSFMYTWSSGSANLFVSFFWVATFLCNTLEGDWFIGVLIAIYNRCPYFLSFHSLHISLESDFWNHHSAETTPSKITHCFLIAKSDVLFLVLILHDGSTISDTVCHPLLFDTLFSLGFVCLFVLWLQSPGSFHT